MTWGKERSGRITFKLSIPTIPFLTKVPATLHLRKTIPRLMTTALWTIIIWKSLVPAVSRVPLLASTFLFSVSLESTFCQNMLHFQHHFQFWIKNHRSSDVSDPFGAVGSRFDQTDVRYSMGGSSVFEDAHHTARESIEREVTGELI